LDTGYEIYKGSRRRFRFGATPHAAEHHALLAHLAKVYGAVKAEDVMAYPPP
jgi:hypothetical protein